MRHRAFIHGPRGRRRTHHEGTHEPRVRLRSTRYGLLLRVMDEIALGPDSSTEGSWLVKRNGRSVSLGQLGW